MRRAIVVQTKVDLDNYLNIFKLRLGELASHEKCLKAPLGVIVFGLAVLSPNTCPKSEPECQVS